MNKKNDFLKVAKSEELQKLVYGYLAQLTYSKLVREKVDAVFTEVLKEVPLYNDLDFEMELTDELERIYTPNRMYLSTDEEMCNLVYKKVNRILKDHKVKPESMQFDYCPALVAEAKTLDLEKAILKLVCEPFEMPYTEVLGNLEVSKQIIDLTVSYVLGGK